jgi:serine O-acetyltransferase
MIKSRTELKDYLREDFRRYIHRLREPNTIVNKLVNWLLIKLDITIAFQKSLRKYEYYSYKWNHGSKLLYSLPLIVSYFKYKKRAQRCGFSISKGSCGKGLFLPHYGGIIINPRAKIGRNCTIHCFVNIGEKDGGVPTIGDDCFIGPGAKIFGNISIGNNVSIGANAVVNKSFPDNCIIAGVPAKIVKYK